MGEKERNDYFYVCALIEYIARETRNHRGDIVRTIGKKGIEKLLCDAEVNHCAEFSRYREALQYYDRGLCGKGKRSRGVDKNLYFFYQRRHIRF